MRRALGLVAIVAIGCSERRSASDAPDAGIDDASTDSGSDASADGGDELPPNRIVLDATDTVIVNDFGLEIVGRGADLVGDIDIRSSGGSIEFDDRQIPVVVSNHRQGWSDGPAYVATGFDAAGWFQFSFMCADGLVWYLYYVGSDGTPMLWEGAGASCIETPGKTSIPVRVPAVDMPFPTLQNELSLSGADVSLVGAAPGRIVLGGREWTALPYEQVDYSSGQTWQLLLLLWDPVGRAAAMGGLQAEGGQAYVSAWIDLSIPDTSASGVSEELELGSSP